MATKNNRDVKLSLSVETLGAEGVKSLRDTIASLAKEGGDAAPEFQRLADEIDRLGDQAKTLQSFEQIAQTVRELGDAQQQAAAKTEKLKAELDTASASTRKASATQAELKAELEKQQKELNATTGALKIQRQAFDENGKRLSDHKSKMSDLTKEQVRLTAVVDDYKSKLAVANKAVAEAESAETKAQKAYNFSEKALDGLTKKLEQRRGEMSNQSKAISDMGLSTDDLAQSQGTLLKSLNDTGAAANKLKSELDAARAAEKALADENARAVAANNEKIKGINDEIKFRQQLAAQREAAAKQAAAAEQAVAAEAAAQLKKQQAEEQAAFNDKISRINMELKYRQQLAAQRAAVENEANRKSVEAEKQAAKEREAAAKAASDAIANAFKTTGAKSASDLRQQIEAVKGAMQLLEKEAGLTGAELKVAMGAGNQQLKELERELRAATGAMTTADKAANLFKNSMGQIAAGNLIADAIGMMVEKVKALGREFIDANVRAEGMTRALNAIYKNSETASSQMDFLKVTANTAGIAVSKISGDFVKFSAAMNSANIPLSESNALFGALTGAAGTLGLSTEKVSDALNALGQVASKGVVSMEELRGQLGDALPGALSMAAKGMGLTDMALVKLVESGQLAASTFIPAFTQGLRELSAENDTLAGSFARLQNATESFFQAIGASGALDVMKGGLSIVTEAAKGAYTGVAVLAEGFFSVGRAAGAAAGALVTGNSVLEAVTNTYALVNARVDAFIQTLYGSEEEAARATAKYQMMQQGLDANANAAFGAAKAMAALAPVIAEQQTKLQLATTAAEKHAKAVEILGSTQVSLAQMTGDLTLKMETEVQAANATVAAKEAVKKATQDELDLAKQALAAYDLLIEQKGGKLEPADLKRRESLQKTITLQEGEIEKVNAEIEASKNLAFQKEIESQKLRDNSARLEELTSAYDSAKRALELVTEAERRGYDVTQQKAKALADLRAAQALLNDAYSDYASKLAANLTLMKSENDLKLASLEATRNSYEASARYYTAIGNETLARQAKINAIQAEIKYTQAAAQAALAEADAKIAVVRAEQQELLSKGQLTPQILAETEARLKSIEAEKIKANASLENVKVLEQQIRALREGKGALDGHTNASTSAAQGQMQFGQAVSATTTALERQNAALERQISAQEKANDLKERADALERKRKNVDKEGFSLNTNGDRLVAAAETETSIFNKLTAGGMSAADADRKAKELYRQYKLWAQGTTSPIGGGLLGSGASANAAPEWLMQPFDNIINQTVRDAKVRSDPNRQPDARQAQQATVTGSTGTVKTYNVNVMGRTIKTNSDADAKALIDVLKQASLTS